MLRFRKKRLLRNLRDSKQQPGLSRPFPEDFRALPQWIEQASLADLQIAWRDHARVANFFSSNKARTIELMSQNPAVALFFMENAKARKQVKLESSDFTETYAANSQNQQYIDLLISHTPHGEIKHKSKQLIAKVGVFLDLHVFYQKPP